MTVETGAGERRVKLSVDITPSLRRRIRLAAASRDLTQRELLISIVEERLAEPGERKGERDG